MKKYVFVIAILALVFQGFKVLSTDSKMIVIKKKPQIQLLFSKLIKEK